jgi:hypothetical protein
MAEMMEMITFGGKTTYIEGFSLSSNLEQLAKGSRKFGKNRIVKRWDDFTKLLDSWNNMFEFTSRTAAYSIYKKEALKRHIAKGLSNEKGPQGQMSPAMRAAATEAAAWTLNLTNFAKSGEMSKVFGAAFMFVRPSAASALRSVEAVLPAFTREKWEEGDLPSTINLNEAAKAKYIENFKKDRTYAQITVATLIGAGMFAYYMSTLMSPEDDWKRNDAKNDNMDQWTRYFRLHLPESVSEKLGLGKEVVFQMPWGFGNGAWLASGAQMGAVLSGQTSLKDALTTIVTTIMTDSFMPIPISKIPFSESPLHWFLDSIAPSYLRPLVEYAFNKNGIGQAINSASNRRLGDAYVGGDRIPEIYKDFSKWLYGFTEGDYDWTPNTVYFFANSYLDGITRIMQNAYSWSQLKGGERDFNPRTDLPLFGSFFGAKTNVDSREYGKMEVEVKKMAKKLETLDEFHPEAMARFEENNPTAADIVDIYEKRQGELNKLRHDATEARNLQGLSIRDRDAIVKMIIMEENLLKHEMVEDFKALGMKKP